MGATVLCEVDFEIADAEDFGRRAVEWVIGGVRALAGDVLSRVSADASVPKGRLTSGLALGPAGAEWGFVSITRMGKNGLRQPGKVVEESTVAWAEKEASKGIVGMNLGFVLLDASGFPSEGIIRFEANILEDVDGWCRVWIEAPESAFQDIATQRAWLRFLRGFCDEVNPSYGQISYEYSVPGVTPLEAVTGPPWTIYYEAISASRSVLRGYSWLTVAASELVDRLGGADALRASGAFTQVEPLRSGGVWLLATENYADYTDESVEAVWRALAPVLLKGTPSRDRAGREESPVRLVFRDAAEVTTS
ncbi:hypothetical protein [Streptomyces sp. NPDC008139]|uniref:hypothetical protein n=1 Tax=Streptomyces sp. NPDC008139 TaxID=3364814 RepID=UPI0036F0851E